MKGPKIKRLRTQPKFIASKERSEKALSELKSHLVQHRSRGGKMTEDYLVGSRTKYDFYENILSKSPKIAYMNMSLLAQVLIYMNGINDNTTNVKIDPKIIEPYVNSIISEDNMNKLTEDEYTILYNRMLLGFYRYLRLVQNLIEDYRNLPQENIELPMIQNYYEDYY
jgi:hypothetical protein